MQSTNNTITTNCVHRKQAPNINSLVLQNRSLNGSFNSVEDLLWDDTLDLLLNLDSRDFYHPNACSSGDLDLLDRVPISRLHDDRIKATNKIGSYKESGGAKVDRVSTVQNNLDSKGFYHPNACSSSDLDLFDRVPISRLHDDHIKATNKIGSYKESGDAKVDSVSTVQKKKLMPMKKNSFPLKLTAILSMPELSHIICWSPHGRAFKVLNPEKLESEVLPKFFKTRKMSSFRKQLSLWGFTRIYSGPDIGSYYHAFFLRGTPQFLNKVKYQKVKGVGKRRRPNPKNGPDFYSMPPLPHIMPEEVTSIPLMRQVTGMLPMLPISSVPEEVTSIPRMLPISSGTELVSDDSEPEPDLTLLRTAQNFSLRQIFEEDCIVAV
eukprot:CAMPEP_0116061276 /NCGR_PEP_ID=MMETSP0322-20121206/6983_1 /TAXON_ID=163516 /ORGANISM="Leptocylindrus danicus var. apora, Strain B651" /LENGTH=378 /DNA_ID=CAMNT_0003546193 /DNA_START=160 /DNA_END=1296 /DNA_ORIENTATION=-